MKLLPLDDILAAAQDAGVPGVEELIAQAEAVAENAANALAQHLGIKCRNTEFWDGKLYTTFLASHPGQECPDAIHAGDPGGEWEADGEEEGDAPSMTMGG
jgi:hypothetical protein